MSLQRRHLLTGGVAAGAALLGAGWAWWRHTPAPAPAAMSPAMQRLWASSFTRPQGGDLALASFQGQPLLLNFWATWCAPCVKEMPDLDRFQKDFAQQGWKVVGLAIDGPTPVREFLQKLPVSFDIGLAGLDGTELIKALGNTAGGLPYTVAINRAGVVVWQKLGGSHYEELASQAAQWAA